VVYFKNIKILQKKARKFYIICCFFGEARLMPKTGWIEANNVFFRHYFETKFQSQFPSHSAYGMGTGEGRYLVKY